MLYHHLSFILPLTGQVQNQDGERIDTNNPDRIPGKAKSFPPGAIGQANNNDCCHHYRRRHGNRVITCDM
jgi:hypothetical protein